MWARVVCMDFSAMAMDGTPCAPTKSECQPSRTHYTPSGRVARVVCKFAVLRDIHGLEAGARLTAAKGLHEAAGIVLSADIFSTLPESAHHAYRHVCLQLPSKRPCL